VTPVNRRPATQPVALVAGLATPVVQVAAQAAPGARAAPCLAQRGWAVWREAAAAAVRMARSIPFCLAWPSPAALVERVERVDPAAIRLVAAGRAAGGR